MAGSLTQQGEKLLLEYSIGRIAPSNESVPTSAGLYLGLATAPSVPSETGSSTSFVEITYTGYARQALAPANWSTVDTTATPTSLTYTAEIRFPAYTGVGATIRYLVLYTASTVGAGVPVWFSEIKQGTTTGRVLLYDDVVVVPQNNLTLKLD